MSYSVGIYVQLTREEIVLALDALDSMPLNPLTFYTRQSLKAKLYTTVYGSKGNQRVLDGVSSIVSEAFRMPLKNLFSHARAQHINLTRQIAFYLSRTMTKRSFPEIGRYFNRNHGTIIHGVNIIAARMTRDSAFRNMIHRLQTTIEDRQNEKPREGDGEAQMGEDNQGAAPSPLVKNGSCKTS